jgi:hypothetical protein
MRQIGFSPCPIALQDILSWLDLNGITDAESRLDTVEIFSRLDRVWLELYNQKVEKDNANNPTGSRRKGS